MRFQMIGLFYSKILATKDNEETPLPAVTTKGFKWDRWQKGKISKAAPGNILPFHDLTQMEYAITGHLPPTSFLIL